MNNCSRLFNSPKAEFFLSSHLYGTGVVELAVQGPSYSKASNGSSVGIADLWNYSFTTKGTVIFISLAQQRHYVMQL